MTDRSSSSPSTTTPPTTEPWGGFGDPFREAMSVARFVETPGLVQMLMAVWVPGKGWLVAKRSMIYGGRHGEAPMVDGDLSVLEQAVAIEAKTGLRAIQSRLKREDG